jgi:myo-inositol 2-dehydrogenase / D-chiro-inositol 1-dehydrogenase
MHKLALIGAGRIGRIHAANAAAHPELQLAYVIDPDANSAATIAAATGAAQATLDDALGDSAIAGVIIASSTDTHLEYCLRAHSAGKAIFCEKPIDQDLQRARGAKSSLQGARLFLGFNRRFDPNFQRLRSLLEGGAVSGLESLQITSNDPAPPLVSYVRSSGGLFKDMAIHDFDMARWLLGEMPTEVFAMGSCLVDPGIGAAGDIDTARTLLKTASGKLCVITNSRRSGFGYDQRIEAFGAGGMLSASNVTESTVQVWTEEGARADRFQNFFLDRYSAAYRAEMAHFADVLADRAAPLITFQDGTAALALAEAAGASLKSGQLISVEPI